MTTQRCSSLLALGLVVVVSSICAMAQQVTSTNPSAAPQGTTTLNVTISGSGFQKGAKAQWFISGTTNPGGVTVNSTSFNGSSALTANITIATGAYTGGFDVVVTNTNGRTGVGRDAFTVTQQGTPLGCYTTGTPSGATLQAVLNPVQSNGAPLISTVRLGNAIRVRPMDLNGDGVVDTLVTFVTSGVYNGSVPGTYIFLLDPVTGQPQATNPVTGAQWQNPVQVLSGVRATMAAAGDVNHDGIPDFALFGLTNPPYLFVGSVDATYTPRWKASPLSAPAGAPSNWGAAVAFGDVDGIGADEIVVSAPGGSKTDTSLPGVFIFKYASGGVSFVREIQNPAGNQTGNFGTALAIGNIDGNAGNELVVGATTANTNGTVYVFPFPVQQSNFFTLTGAGPNFGRGLGIADVNRDGSADLLVVTGSQGSSTAQAFLYAGNVSAASTYANQLLPATGWASGWATPNIDVADMAVTGAVAVGSPNAASCSSIQGGQGAVHLFTSFAAGTEQPNYLFQTPSLSGSNQFEYGYGVGIAPGYPFIVIGEHMRDVGNVTQAGQVYVYKLN